PLRLRSLIRSARGGRQALSASPRPWSSGSMALSLAFVAPTAPTADRGVPKGVAWGDRPLEEAGPAPSLRAASAPERPRAEGGAALGPALGAGALAAAAGAALSKGRRRATARRAITDMNSDYIRDYPVYENSVNFINKNGGATAVPGSEKALKTMVGAGPEINDGEIWDPLGFAKLYDRNFDFNMVMTWPHVQWLREAELKHGRVCMLAFVGMVTQSFFQIPGEPQEPNYWKALDACYADPVGRLGVVQISVFIALMEGKYFPEDAWIGQMDREPGDLGWDPLKFAKKPGFDLQEKQLTELKNGRLAMMGVASLACEHVIPGSVPLLSGAP
ncbi:unnamed protein product, partial [Prorocentrum cordatum]